MVGLGVGLRARLRPTHQVGPMPHRRQVLEDELDAHRDRDRHDQAHDPPEEPPEEAGHEDGRPVEVE